MARGRKKGQTGDSVPAGFARRVVNNYVLVTFFGTAMALLVLSGIAYRLKQPTLGEGLLLATVVSAAFGVVSHVASMKIHELDAELRPDLLEEVRKQREQLEANTESLSRQIEGACKPIEKDVSIVLRTLGELSSQLVDEYRPTYISPPSSEPDARLNDLIVTDFLKTKQFHFLGKSATYATALLTLRKDSKSLDVRIGLIHPRDDDAVSFEAHNRIQQRPNVLEGVPLEEVKSNVKDDIFMTLVILAGMAPNTEVSLIWGRPTYRIELYDDAVYLSLFDDDNAQRTVFPEARRYQKGSMTYRQVRILGESVFQGSKGCPEYIGKLTASELPKVLENLGATNSDPPALEAYKERFRDRMSSVLSRLEAAAEFKFK